MQSCFKKEREREKIPFRETGPGNSLASLSGEALFGNQERNTQRCTARECESHKDNCVWVLIPTPSCLSVQRSVRTTWERGERGNTQTPEVEIRYANFFSFFSFSSTLLPRAGQHPLLANFLLFSAAIIVPYLGRMLFFSSDPCLRCPRHSQPLR